MGYLCGTLQAISCHATIIPSLRDKDLNACPRIRRQITTDRAPPFRGRRRRRGRERGLGRHQPPTTNRQLPTANGQLPTANGQRPTATAQHPTANRHPLTTTQLPASLCVLY